MSESVSAVLALLMIIGMIGSVLVFMNDRVNWTAFGGMLTLLFGSLGLLVWSLFRRDKAPDFLKTVPRRLLERDGFYFKVLTNPVKGRCYLDLHFQTRYERPSRAIVVLQATKDLFLLRPGVASMTVEIECPAGGYGMTSVPWPVARKAQGKARWLDVGADVTYPEGRGKMIRYLGCIQAGRVQVGTVALRAAAAVMAGLTFGLAMGGAVVMMQPARVKLRFPVDVEESVDDDLPILTKVVWKLGDPPGHPSAGKGLSTDPDF